MKLFQKCCQLCSEVISTIHLFLSLRYFQCFFSFSHYFTSVFFTVVIDCFIACLTRLSSPHTNSCFVSLSFLIHWKHFSFFLGRDSSEWRTLLYFYPWILSYINNKLNLTLPCLSNNNTKSYIYGMLSPSYVIAQLNDWWIYLFSSKTELYYHDIKIKTLLCSWNKVSVQSNKLSGTNQSSLSLQIAI